MLFLPCYSYPVRWNQVSGIYFAFLCYFGIDFGLKYLSQLYDGFPPFLLYVFRLCFVLFFLIPAGILLVFCCSFCFLYCCSSCFLRWLGCCCVIRTMLFVPGTPIPGVNYLVCSPLFIWDWFWFDFHSITYGYVFWHFPLCWSYMRSINIATPLHWICFQAMPGDGPPSTRTR